MNNDTELIHTRLPKALLKRLDHFAVEAGLYRQEAVQLLIEEALDTGGFHWPPAVKTELDTEPREGIRLGVADFKAGRSSPYEPTAKGTPS